jgi:hypothetical protein
MPALSVAPEEPLDNELAHIDSELDSSTYVELTQIAHNRVKVGFVITGNGGSLSD